MLETLEPLGSIKMRTTKFSIVATLIAGALASGVAMADSQPQRFGSTPSTAIGPATGGVLFYPVTCLMGSGDVMADVLIRNTSPSVIPAGTNIDWQVAGGIGGAFNVGRGGLAPGDVVEVGAAHYPFTCSASL